MAITCSLGKNLKRTDFCGYSLKQIVNIYLCNYGDVNGTDIKIEAADGYEVTAITATTKKFSIIEPAKDTASYSDDLTIGGNGSKYRKHTLTFSFNGAYSADLAAIVDTLSLGKFIAVLELSDGSAIMLGRLVGLEATAVSSLSEAAADGQNGINVTMEANTTEAALVVSSDALTSIKGALNA